MGCVELGCNCPNLGNGKKSELNSAGQICIDGGFKDILSRLISIWQEGKITKMNFIAKYICSYENLFMK